MRCSHRPTCSLRFSLLALALVALFCLPATGVAQQTEEQPAKPLKLPLTTAQSLVLDLQGIQLDDESLGRLKVGLSGLDLAKGTLMALETVLYQGEFDNNISVDELRITTDSFSFDTAELLENQRFVLSEPVNAGVNLNISEESMNRFFSNPKTLAKPSKAIRKATGGFISVNFIKPRFQMLNSQKVQLNVLMVMGNALAAPIQMIGDIKIVEGKLQFQNLTISSAQSRLPVDVASVFEKELNKLIDLDRLNKDSFRLKANQATIADKVLHIQGVATITRLEFGKGKKS